MPIKTLPKSLKEETLFHYCPGCSHGIVHRLICEVIDELGIQGITVGVCPVGCAYNSYQYFDFDTVQASHGRAPAVATGIKRVLPDRVVFTYQGDGDLAAIGAAEIIHAVARGENLTTIFVNNAIYGMTAGQMSPTSLLRQVTTTSPEGREVKQHGFPIRMTELLAGLEGAVFLERVSAHDVAHIRLAKQAIRKAFQIQIKGLGYSIVEVLSICPTNWKQTPLGAVEWLKKHMIPYYPLGNIKGKDLVV